jgi:hypothetical protein
MWQTENSELKNLKKDIEELEVAGPKIKNLDFLYEFPKIKKLSLHSIKTNDLTPIASLKNITNLALTNVGNGASLQPLSQLTSLKELILQTPPGWDGSSKHVKYMSLQPLTNIEGLKDLTLLDVVFEMDGLEPLIKIKSLSQLTIRNKFSTKDFAKLAKFKPELNCRYTQPYTTWDGFEYYRCNKCGGMKVEFSGIDLKRRVFCLNCNKNKCDELIERFYRIKNDV